MSEKTVSDETLYEFAAVRGLSFFFGYVILLPILSRVILGVHVLCNLHQSKRCFLHYYLYTCGAEPFMTSFCLSLYC